MSRTPARRAVEKWLAQWGIRNDAELADLLEAMEYDADRGAPHCNYDCDACRASAKAGECYDCDLNPGLCDFHDRSASKAMG